MTRPLKIAWGPIASPGAPYGYGTIGLELKLALQQAGASFAGLTEIDYDMAITMGWPASWVIGKQMRPDMVWHTMFECVPFPTDWAKVVNRSAGLWAPSAWVKEQFEIAGVTRPIAVAGYGIKKDIYEPPAVDRNQHTGPFRVLAWARGLLSRKNLLMAIKVFVAANLPDAVMEVKVNVDDELSRDGMSVTGHKEIRFIKADWPAMQVANWLRGGDVMLYLSSGEGFGLMPLEAMATGLPVICAYNSGMMDYLTPQNALLVQCPSLAPVPSFNYFREPAPPVFFGYQPDFDEAVAHLRWAYANREAAYAIGRQAAVDTHHWTWQRAGAKALAALETFAGG